MIISRDHGLGTTLRECSAGQQASMRLMGRRYDEYSANDFTCADFS